MTEIYVAKSTFEKNASDGIDYFTDKNALADAVYEVENLGGTVQVYKCVPISHEVYPARLVIELYDEE